MQSEGEVQQSKLKCVDGISLAEDIYKKEEQVSGVIEARSVVVAAD